MSQYIKELAMFGEPVPNLVFVPLGTKDEKFNWFYRFPEWVTTMAETAIDLLIKEQKRASFDYWRRCHTLRGGSIIVALPVPKKSWIEYRETSVRGLHAKLSLRSQPDFLNKGEVLAVRACFSGQERVAFTGPLPSGCPRDEVRVMKSAVSELRAQIVQTHEAFLHSYGERARLRSLSARAIHGDSVRATRIA